MMTVSALLTSVPWSSSSLVVLLAVCLRWKAPVYKKTEPLREIQYALAIVEDSATRRHLSLISLDKDHAFFGRLDPFSGLSIRSEKTGAARLVS